MSEPAPYRRTLADRYGPDVWVALRALGLSAPVGLGSVVWDVLLGVRGWALVQTVLVALGTVAGVAALAYGVACGAGAFALRVVFPSGGSCPAPRTYWQEETCAARGDTAGALAGYAVAVAARPGEVAAYFAAAELCALTGDARGAAGWYAAARRAPGLTTDAERAATSRLSDLYLGPLGDPGRALVELRRLADRHPESVEGRAAPAAIARIKAARGAAA